LASVSGGTSKDGGALRGKTGRLIRLLGLRPGYAELMHPRSQGARVEAQDHCGPALPLDAPFGLGKNSKDLIALQLFQGSYGGGHGRGGSGQGVCEVQDRPGTQDHGPFEDAFELPDVPGPGVLLEGFHRLLLDRVSPVTQ